MAGSSVEPGCRVAGMADPTLAHARNERWRIKCGRGLVVRCTNFWLAVVRCTNFWLAGRTVQLEETTKIDNSPPSGRLQPAPTPGQPTGRAPVPALWLNDLGGIGICGIWALFLGGGIVVRSHRVYACSIIACLLLASTRRARGGRGGGYAVGLPSFAVLLDGAIRHRPGRHPLHHRHRSPFRDHEAEGVGIICVETTIFPLL